MFKKYWPVLLLGACAPARTDPTTVAESFTIPLMIVLIIAMISTYANPPQ